MMTHKQKNRLKNNIFLLGIILEEKISKKLFYNLSLGRKQRGHTLYSFPTMD